MSYTVGKVASLAHISVRTLHYYDELGLIVPSARSDSGYRLYTDEDLLGLQQVLFFKALGFDLHRIQFLIKDPSFNRLQALTEQRNLTNIQIKRLKKVVDLIDKAILDFEGERAMSNKEMFEVFGEFDPSEFEEEVNERFGGTEAYAESARRTKKYGKKDWERMKKEEGEIFGSLTKLMEKGVAPDDEQAMDGVEQYRLHIDHWFYPCSRRMQGELGKMYLADQRFKDNFDKVHQGLSIYVSEAIAANVERG